MSSQRSPVERLRRSIELLWRGGERPAPGPKPSLTLDKIIDAAIAVADADGIEALSMRRVAAELGVGTMSLYRYVPSKSELLTLMFDKVNDPTECIDQAAGKDWRARLETAARNSYRLYVSHPWLLRVNWYWPVFGPNTLGITEFVVASLDGLGLSDQERMSAINSLDAFVAGMARQRVDYEAATEATGVSEEEFWSQQYPALERAMSSGGFPAMAALSEDAFSLGWEETFEHGLAWLIDGIVAQVERRRTEPPDGG